MANEKTWRQLVDGDRLHSRHILQLADEGRQFAGSLFVAACEPPVLIASLASSRSPSASESGKRNVLSVEVEKRRLWLDDIAVVTRAGRLASVPPPSKSIDLPSGGDGRDFLTLKLETFEESNGRGSASPNWVTREESLRADVVLGEWSERTQELIFIPLPLLLSSQSEVEQQHQALKSACGELWEALVMAEPRSLQRIGVEAEQRYLLDPLVQALERIQSQGAGMLASAAMRELSALQLELAGWYRHLSAKSAAGSSLVVNPDCIGRRRLAALRGNDGLPDEFALLAFPAPTTSSLIASLARLASVVANFTRVILGQSEEVSINPINEFALPMGGRAYVYDLAQFAGKECGFRVELLADVEPQLLWGLDTAGHPLLTPLEFTGGGGRFDGVVPPFVPLPSHKLTIGTRPAASALKLFQTTAR